MLLKKLTICIISILFGIILCVSLSMDHNGKTYENKFNTEQHKNYEKSDFEQQDQNSAYKTFIKIFINNIIVGILLSFGGFFTGGLITCFLLVANAFFVTSVILKCIETNLTTLNIIKLFLYHGILEVPAFLWFSIIGIEGYFFFQKLYNKGIIIWDKIPKIRTLIFPSFLIFIAAIIETALGYKL